MLVAILPDGNNNNNKIVSEDDQFKTDIGTLNNAGTNSGQGPPLALVGRSRSLSWSFPITNNNTRGLWGKYFMR